MKHDLDESVNMIENRIHEIKIEKQRRSIIALSSVSALLFALCVITLYHFIDFGETPGTYSVFGTLMISEESGAYVLVGVLSFFAAVALTLLCLYIAKRRRSSAGPREREKAED